MSKFILLFGLRIAKIAAFNVCLKLVMQRKILEQDVPLSRSRIWHAQRRYYTEQGIAAWSGDVPHYVTSNPVIAQHYALHIMHFIQDWQAMHPTKTRKHFYILELGAGAGQFAFYCLQALTRLQVTFKLENIKLHYIMSDISTKNIAYWRQHPALQTYFKANVLEVACYDLEHDDTIELQISGKVLQKNSLQTPLLVIANYLFDSLAHDAFHIKNNTITASHLTLSTTNHNITEGRVKQWRRVKIEYHEQAITENYYPEKSFNRILQYYQTELHHSRILFPHVALRALHNLSALSRQRLLLLSADKGYTSLASLDGIKRPHFAYHGSFSVMVNYHAMAQYFQQQQGAALIQAGHGDIVCAAFVSGLQFSTLPRLQQSLQQHLLNFSAVDYFNIYEHLAQGYDDMSFNALLSHLALARWDPNVFMLCHARLIDLIDSVDDEAKNYLCMHLAEIAKQVYSLPNDEDVYFAIAMIYQDQDYFNEAINYYQLSRQHYADSYATAFNLGYCYQAAQQVQQARLEFQRALQFKPRDQEAKQWLATLRTML